MHMLYYHKAPVDPYIPLWVDMQNKKESNNTNQSGKRTKFAKNETTVARFCKRRKLI